ncbi:MULTISPECIES: c-type cytochrome domain-containing protein [unclassified Lentimonas]|uniref:c-type cytochrome domain-containing protein n=1 Tax=unclassified Lentimonas TaxID=2630993 RepID=UPI001389A252|nr:MULTISPECIES: c-type cytochrome domain-containing protein [unclassified Lentimonas]
MPDFLMPFGPFHMVALHLPIGALTAIWFLEIMLSNNGEKHKNPAIGLLHLFLLLSTGLTIALGLSYETLGKYGEEIESHELWGYIFGGGVLLSYCLYWIHRLAGKRGTKLCYMLSLVATTVAMTVAGHLGGELVHGKGFLTKPFKPERVRTVAPAPATEAPVTVTPAAEPEMSVSPDLATTPKPAPTPEPTVDKEMESMEPMMDAMSGEMMNSMSGEMMDSMTAVAPMPTSTKADPRIALFEDTQAIFKRHCYNCHGATKQKGDYRLDSKHSINLAGKSGFAAITPGNVEDSELMYRMLLPRDDDDVMPPEKKDPVSPKDIETVRQWIEQGAYWPDEAELNSAPGEYIKIGDTNTDEWIEQINSTGVKAEYNAWGDDSVRVDLGVVEPGQLDQALQQLTQVSDKLTWLDCSQLTLPTDFFDQLAQFTKLQRLHLDGTGVTDAQLKQLSQLPELSYLNLYNTQINDTALATLQEFPSLKKVFVSQTKVTPKGINQLKKARPDLELIYN